MEEDYTFGAFSTLSSSSTTEQAPHTNVGTVRHQSAPGVTTTFDRDETAGPTGSTRAGRTRSASRTVVGGAGGPSVGSGQSVASIPSFKFSESVSRQMRRWRKDNDVDAPERTKTMPTWTHAPPVRGTW